MTIADPKIQEATGTLSVAGLMGTVAERHPAGIAIISHGRAPLTYGRLCSFIQEVGKSLNELGIGRNDRVAVVVHSGAEMAVAFVAVGASATCVPLNPAYRASEFDLYLSDLRPKALIVQSGIDSEVITVARHRGIGLILLEPCLRGDAGIFTISGEKLQGPIDEGFAQPDDIALVLYTSGTTGRPKQIHLTHANICSSAKNIAATLELDNRDRCLNVMSFYHIHGLIGATLSTLATGGTLICPPAFNQINFFEWLEEFRPSWYTAVPPIHQAILERAWEYADTIRRNPLRFVRSCSAPLPPRIMAELERVFNAPVIEAYGMTEASHQISSNPLPPRVRKVGSVGKVTGCEVAIADEVGNLLPTGVIGEIVIRGQNIARNYRNGLSPQESADRNKWFRTGDQGFLDADGYLFIKGRLKEIINRGGTKISPREVEEVLLEHPGVAQAAVFGFPHRVLGEDIAAAVVLRKKATVAERDIRQFAAMRLADFRVPSRILIVDEIPKGASGKLQRSQLTDRFAPMLSSQFVAPSDALEWQVARTWANVLGIEKVGINDNFFELGGTSLSALRMFSELHRITGRNLPITVLLEAPTVKQLVEVLHQQQSSESWPSLVAIQPRGSRPPFFCVHGGGGYVLHYRYLASYLGSDQPFYALQQQGLDGVHTPHRSIEDMASHYVQEIMAVRSEGPYFLGGYSFGAAVAFEMARQLNARGHSVALLVLINGFFPTTVNGSSSISSEISFRLRTLESRLDYAREIGLRDLSRSVVRRISRIASRLFPIIPKSVPSESVADSSAGASALPPEIREIDRINDQAARMYVPQPYQGSLTIFLSRQEYRRHDFRVPRRLAVGGAKIHKVPGDHVSMLEEPRVRVLAAKLRACLDQAIESSAR